jgi:hypothetical protein
MFSLEQPEYQTWDFNWGFTFDMAGKTRLLNVSMTIECDIG